VTGSKLYDRLARAVAPEGRYEVLSELGRGGMATVFRARDVRHDRDVAIKVLLPELAASLEARRFLREIEIAAGLVHPHILPLYDSAEVEGLLFHVTPCVEGETLRERLQRERHLPIEDAVRIATEIADALDFAHSQGVIHRDVKPENILLSRRHALIMDFGVARAISLGGGERLTETGMAVGTPVYMSPEQARGEEELDGRSDVYSLACCTYEMLAGEPPLSGRTPQIVMSRRQVETPTSLRILRETVPEILDAAVLKALARLPADRYAAARQYAEAIQAGLASLSGAHGTVSTPAIMAAADTASESGVRAKSANEPVGGRPSFLQELKRRKVYNVGAVYAAVAVAISGLAADALDDFGLEAMERWVHLGLFVGLPVALFMAWTFEVTREGVRRTGTFAAVDPASRRWPLVSRRALIAAVLILALYGAWELVRGLTGGG
jgi:serine/threonine-protein kinase